MSPLVLPVVYVALCLLPLPLAAMEGYPLRSFLREFSSGLAMVGFAMALVQFALSGRFEWISGQTGIDRTMRFHQVAAWAILAIVVVHPFLYVISRLSPDPMDALTAVTGMFSSQRLRSGVIAWCLMILLVLMAILRDRLPFRYETWRLSHGLFAVAIAGSGLHHMLRAGIYSADPWLAAYWVIATAGAFLAMFRIYLFKPVLQLSKPYRVVSNRRVAHRMWEVAIEPEQGPAIDFAPGQFVWLNLGHSPFSLTEHPFSISSASQTRPQISFTIKESGDFTNRIGAIAVGTRAYLDGPHGNFTLKGRTAKSIAFIAGGVGFAPIIAILRQLAAERYPHPLRLLYGNRIETQILYPDEIETLKDSLDFEAHYVLSEPPPGWAGAVGDLSPLVVGGFLDAIGPGNRFYFVCGPPPMMDSVERALRDRGVSRRYIVSERFKY